MDGETPAKPRERKVTNQGTGWKMPFLLILSLLQAANALKGPKLVSGEPGGAVTIQCHYTPLSVNKHQRKYWCRLELPKRTCNTVVSTSHYTHRDYRGRVSLADFPLRGLFVVKLSQLSPRDVGRYRCGIGERNNRLFLNMNLTLSAGPSKAIPMATLAAGELVTPSFGTGSPAANRCTPGATYTLEGQGTEWDRVAPTSAMGRQPPAIARAVTPEIGSGAEGSIKATVPTPESPTSKLRRVPNMTEGVWVQDMHSLVPTPESPTSKLRIIPSTTEGVWVLGTHSLVPTPESPTSKLTGMPNTTEGVWVQGTHSLVPTTESPTSKLRSVSNMTEGIRVWGTHSLVPTPESPTSKLMGVPNTTEGVWVRGTHSLVPTPESPTSKLRNIPSTTEGVWVQGTHSLVPTTESPTSKLRSVSNMTEGIRVWGTHSLVPTPESPTSKLRSVSNMTEGIRVWGTHSLVPTPESPTSKLRRVPNMTDGIRVWGTHSLVPATESSTSKLRSVSNMTEGVWVRGNHSLVPTPESPTSKLRSMPNTTEGVWVQGTYHLVTNIVRVSQGRRQMTTKADKPGEETDRVRIALDETRRTKGTMSPPTPVSEQLAQETLPEATRASKQGALGSTKELTLATGMQTLDTNSTETVSVDKSTDGDLDSTVGDMGPQATPSHGPAADPLSPPDVESSMKNAFPEEASSSRILIPVSTVLAPFLIMALVLLQMRLWRNRPAQEAKRTPSITLTQMTHFLEPNLPPVQLPRVERKMLQDDSPTQPV